MTENGKSGSEPRSGLTKMLPAAFALLLIAALVILWQIRKAPAPDQGAAPLIAKPASPVDAPKQPGPPPVKVSAAAPAAKAVPPGEEGDHNDVKPYPVENVPPKAPPPNLSPAEIAQKVKEGEEWLKKNQKPALTGNEKVDRAAAATKNLELATADLEKQIKDAEQNGRKDEVAEKKIRLRRLRSRLDAIGKAVADKRDPSGSVDELGR